MVAGTASPAPCGNPKLRNLRFRCTECGAPDPELTPSALHCASCGRRYPVREGRPIFDEPPQDAAEDPLDRLKRPLKRFRGLYRLLTNLISPLYFDRTRGRFIADNIRGREGAFLNLGSGNTDLGPQVVNVDIAPYEGVDIVCDIRRLPFPDGSIDGVLTISVLEHVPDPQEVLEEIRRVLRPGGWVYTDVPFVVGFHASPNDYTRWTYEGVRRLHRGFETVRIVNNGGPTSALLWVFQEWIAVLLSFGSRRLHTMIYLLAMCLTFPVKFLDFLLKRHPLARNITSCFIYIGRKPEKPA